MSIHSLRLAFVVSAAALLTPAIAVADADPDAPNNPRLGFYGGFALHGGNISCEGANCGDFREAGGADGHAGYLFSDKLALHFDLWVMGSKQNDFTLSFSSATVGVRYWVMPIIFVQGGVGVGHATLRYDGLFEAQNDSDDVPVIQLGAGIELIRSKRWAMDLEAKVAWGSSTNDDGDRDSTGRMVGAGVGFTWF